MRGNESKSPNEQLAERASDAQMVLYELSSVALVLETLLNLSRECTFTKDPKFIDGILSGSVAILAWQKTRACDAADSLDVPGAGR